MALVSIILPVFNGSKFLEQSIKSCLTQTYLNVELVIVNDKSTDNSQEIAQEFAKNDSRIKIINNHKNLGLPASLNIGHAVACGDFFTWTSDDNYFNTNTISVLLKKIKSHRADIVFGNFFTVNEKGKRIGKYEYAPNKTLLFNNIIGACFLYKRLVYQRNEGYNEELHTIEDYDFWLRASKHSAICHIPEFLYNYRKHKNSLSSNIKNGPYSEKKLFQKKLEKVYKNFIQEFSSEDAVTLSETLSRLHLSHEVNVLDFISNATDKKIINLFSDYFQQESLAEEINLRLRYNIQNYRCNQTFSVLLVILQKKPKLLFDYGKKRTLHIILKILKTKLF
mgnify:CR=1 FL=1